MTHLQVLLDAAGSKGCKVLGQLPDPSKKDGTTNFECRNVGTRECLVCKGELHQNNNASLNVDRDSNVCYWCLAPDCHKRGPVHIGRLVQGPEDALPSTYALGRVATPFRTKLDAASTVLVEADHGATFEMEVDHKATTAEEEADHEASAEMERGHEATTEEEAGHEATSAMEVDYEATTAEAVTDHEATSAMEVDYEATTAEVEMEHETTSTTDADHEAAASSEVEKSDDGDEAQQQSWPVSFPDEGVSSPALQNLQSSSSPSTEPAQLHNYLEAVICELALMGPTANRDHMHNILSWAAEAAGGGQSEEGMAALRAAALEW